MATVPTPIPILATFGSVPGVGVIVQRLQIFRNANHVEGSAA